MTALLSMLFTFALSCAVARAAALIPVPGLPPSVAVAALEQNRGQAKAEILFLVRGPSSMAATAQSILYSPLGVELTFVQGNSNPGVRFTDALPGSVNSANGPDQQKWVTGISRFSTAHLAGVYPGVDVEYTMAADGQLTLNLLCSPGADVKQIVFEVAGALGNKISPDGSLVSTLGPTTHDPVLVYPPAVAHQGNAAVPVAYSVQSEARFAFALDRYDNTLPLKIEVKLGGSISGLFTGARQAVDTAGNTFFLANIPDAAGKTGPFASSGRRAGCGSFTGEPPTPCLDTAVYKFSKIGQFIFATYLNGATRDAGNFLQLTPDGALMVTGTTDSADFPSSRAALQPVYGGPAPIPGSGASISGDFFAARMDAATGALLTSTFLGGPNADTVGETALGSDGSVYFLPKWLGAFSARMPATASALQPVCQADPCVNGYAAHLSPALDRLLYGTYLPGTSTSSAKLHSDGSVYYAGYSTGGFPVTAGAYQQAPAGKEDAIVGRLDPSGSKLVFGTYIGGVDTDWILRTAVAPDGSVWAAVSSFVQCCVNIRNRLVRFDPNGQRLLADKPIDVGDVAVDPAGSLHATAAGPFTVGPDAFLGNACAQSALAYIKLSPSGEQLFASYLPYGSGTDFDGKSVRGLPILKIGDGRFEVAEGQSMGVYTGCVLDAASFGNPDTISPGEIVTLFGSRMGPLEGIAFRPQDGRVPTSLGGTRVLVNGEPVPILFASYWQVNAILPYSLQEGARPKIQVESNGSVGNELAGSFVQRARISLFRTDNTANPPAAALNEDGTVNSARNPAKNGSRVVLFGTGGGPTVPASVAGEITPLELRRLQYGATVQIAQRGPMLMVEFAGAAPGLVAGVIQINVKLPDALADIEGYPRGVLPLFVYSPGLSFYPAYVTVAVEVK
ncbi:MAG: hypothetical protein ABJF23_26375 [Bryobacteraceae bacterium]